MYFEESHVSGAAYKATQPHSHIASQPHSHNGRFSGDFDQVFGSRAGQCFSAGNTAIVCGDSCTPLALRFIVFGRLLIHNSYWLTCLLEFSTYTFTYTHSCLFYGFTRCNTRMDLYRIFVHVCCLNYVSFCFSFFFTLFLWISIILFVRVLYFGYIQILI